MSHELRTPSNAIIGYSEILAEGAKADQRGEDLKDTQKILVFGNHLLALINQMLDHAAVESGALPLKPVRTAIAPIVRDVAATAHPLARQNETKLEVIGEAMVDPFRLKQCLVNIVRNAAEFTPSGEVHISCARSVRVGRE
jgi:signal transduction histidine kinase